MQKVDMQVIPNLTPPRKGLHSYELKLATHCIFLIQLMIEVLYDSPCNYATTENTNCSVPGKSVWTEQVAFASLQDFDEAMPHANLRNKTY